MYNIVGMMPLLVLNKAGYLTYRKAKKSHHSYVTVCPCFESNDIEAASIMSPMRNFMA